MKKKTIPITRPTLESYAAYAPLFKRIVESEMLTTHRTVEEFERRVANYLGVKYCVAVSSCTAGLMLVLKGLNIKGEVIMPSFTFSATGHALLWNRLKPVFADIDPNTFTIDPQSVEKLITRRTSAILAVHAFGLPCDVEALKKIAQKHKLKLIFDAAHAFGARSRGKKIGSFGDAEVFSGSPIKVLTCAEGGIVATNNKALAQFVRMGRNYGDDGTNNSLFAGLSARMSEFHAAVGLRSLAKLSHNLKNRRDKAAYFVKKLAALEPGLQFQKIPPGRATTYYIFSLRIDPKKLPYTRNDLQAFFSKKGIATRKYFYPPLHRQPPYARFVARRYTLPVTDDVSTTIVALPLYAHLSKRDMDRIVATFRDFRKKVTLI